MFGHEWNEQEERKALLETGELRAKLVAELSVKHTAEPLAKRWEK